MSERGAGVSVAGGAIVVLAAAFLVGAPESAEARGECGGTNYVYDNYKKDIPLWPDDHGDTNLFEPSGEEWEYDHTDIHDYFHHNNFQEHGYSHDAHSFDVCEEDAGGGT